MGEISHSDPGSSEALVLLVAHSTKLDRFRYLVVFSPAARHYSGPIAFC